MAYNRVLNLRPTYHVRLISVENSQGRAARLAFKICPNRPRLGIHDPVLAPFGTSGEREVKTFKVIQ